MLRVEWNVPEGSLCDAYTLNYTILTLSKPKSFTVSSTEPHALLKMFTDHKIDVRNFAYFYSELGF